MNKEYWKKLLVRMTAQLGMHPSTARRKLVSSIIFSFIEKMGIKCYRCGEVMTSANWTIEHKDPWLDHQEASRLYFDLENITFSHHGCNVGAARKPTKKLEIDHGNYTNFVISHKRPAKCKCDKCREAWNTYKRSRYSPDARRAKYLRVGS